MAKFDLRTNPDAQANAPSPSIHLVAANGTPLYAEEAAEYITSQAKA